MRWLGYLERINKYKHVKLVRRIREKEIDHEENDECGQNGYKTNRKRE